MQQTHGERFAQSTIWRCLDRHSQTFKKTARASQQERLDVAARQDVWRQEQPDLDLSRLIFVDETGASTKMARRWGGRNAGRVLHRVCPA